MAVLPWYSNADKPIDPGHGLGRRTHIGRMPFPRMAAHPVALLTPQTFTVNRRLDLPRQYIAKYDQGSEGSCVGFAWSWAMSIINRRFYAARKLYLETQFIDPWGDTPPEEGTSVVSAAEVLRDQGHWRFARGITFPVAAFEGIAQFRQAQSVDEIRLGISLGIPTVLGMDWMSDYDSPKWIDPGKGGPRWWIGRDPDHLGQLRGGHAICLFGARDDIEAFVLVNNWGPNYPIVYIPYITVEKRVLQAGGDAIIPTDR